MRVEVSTDGKRWQEVAGVVQDWPDAWRELRLKRAVDARYVRLVFTNPNGVPRLGGVAEVEVRRPEKPESKPSNPKEEQHRVKPGNSIAKPEHKRAESGKRYKGNNVRKRAKDQTKGKSGGKHRLRARRNIPALPVSIRQTAGG